MITIKLLLAITWLPFIISQDDNNNDVPFNLDPDVDGGTQICRTKEGRAGICVHEGYCTEDHYILPGGVIEDSEKRSGSICPSTSTTIEWCCSLDYVNASAAIKNNASSASDACQPLKDDRCPWCVKLYKVFDLNNADSGAFCVGSLISSNLILTAASCLQASKHHILYARIPTSADPNHKYIAKDRKLHPQYNGGTHWFDYGIIVLSEDVNWGVTPAKIACLKFEVTSERCFTLGFDIIDEFVSTRLNVSQGRCSNLGGGGSTDVFCGRSIEDLCFASIGAPVICESNIGLVMQGVVRSDCEQNNVLLGSLTYPFPWLKLELERMNVTKPLPKLPTPRIDKRSVDVLDVCQPLDSDKCTWCVKLYKVSDLNNTDSGAFCIGSLIGSNIILTAASCLKAAQDHILYARIPTSSNPDYKYIVKDWKLHPQYNADTQWFDYGIIVLDQDVNWGVTPARGACLNFESISKRCFTLGYDTKHEFVSTVLTVSKGPCMGGGDSPDVSCGTSGENPCFAYPGAPVICEISSGDLVIQGVVRSHCAQNNVLLGSLNSSTSWITTELEKLNVSKRIYTQY